MCLVKFGGREKSVEVCLVDEHGNEDLVFTLLVKGSKETITEPKSDFFAGSEDLEKRLQTVETDGNSASL